MKKKEFKTESKKLMDLMINSIYTNKEVFLREIVSNASDALDKLHYESLTDKKMKVSKDKLEINISIDKDSRKLIISDNGIGMTKEELEKNLGTIAKSGSEDFKENNEHKKDIDIIGQFGVGFYSAFMVASKVEVISKAYGSDDAYIWESEGIDGYTINEGSRDNYGTDVILTIREDSDLENYSIYLEDYEIQTLIKKYSNYITYPIKMEVTHQHLKDKENENDKDEYETVTEVEVINDLVPLWKRKEKDIKAEEYDTFYSDKFFDYEKPIKHIHTKAEGTIEYNALVYIPSHAPFDFYTKEYEKGLQLYSNGVLIMEKCQDLVPDYFSFLKGVVDSSDLPLNISRETIQQNRVLKTIAKSLETKILKELENMRDNEREDYNKFYEAFGMQLKYGVYADYGMNKDKLQDLIMFVSSNDKKLTTLKEYVERMNVDQKEIYYACGESVDKIDLIPQVDAVKSKGFEVLYCKDYVDEFAIKMLGKYADKDFKNVCDDRLELDSKEETEKLNKKNEESKDMFNIMKEAIPEVKDIKFTNKLNNHPVCLSSAGEITVEMEKAMNAIPGVDNVKAEKILEINENHDIASKLAKLYNEDKDALKDYAKILYAQARLIEGLSIENPTEISNLITSIISK
ncbi:MAG: molecular chaperone HtpG [Firmicutes bacterium]|nr:molecular chaperone HtpG [Bacillota bacterium]